MPGVSLIGFIKLESFGASGECTRLGLRAALATSAHRLSGMPVSVRGVAVFFANDHD